MKRRTFIKQAATGVVTAAASLAVSAPAVIASPNVKWTAASFWTRTIPIMFEAIENFCRDVKEMSDGRFEITLYGGGELMPSPGVFDAVSNGTIQMGTGSPYFWADKSTALNWFGSIPFGMNAQSINAWFYEGNGQALMNELYDRFDLVPRIVGNSGVQMGGWYRKKISSIKDFDGLKMRVGNMAGKVLSEVGVTALHVPPAGILAALENGVIDAAEFVGPVHDAALGLYKVAHYYYAPGWQEPGPTLDMFFNKKAYHDLPMQFQKILDIAAGNTNIRTLAAYDAQSGAALERLVKDHHVEVLIYPDDVIKTLKQMSKNVIEAEARKDPFALKVHEDYRMFQAKTASWGALSEKTYWNTMA